MGVSYWFLAIPVGYMLSNYFSKGLNGIWIGLFSGLVLTCLTLLFRFYTKSKKGKIKLYQEESLEVQ
jgi:MATE family multidrug resistance protein